MTGGVRRIAGGFDLGGTLFYRALGLGLGLLSSVVLVSILTQRFGATSYALFALVASLVNLLPFADLGMGASVVNTVSDLRGGRVDERAAALHLSRARDVLALVGVGIAAVAVAVTLLDAWDPLLGAVGDEPGAGIAAAYTFVCFGVAVPLGLGNRMLQGSGRMRAVAQIALLSPAVQLGGCLALTAAGAAAPAFAFLPGTAYLVVALVSYVVARRGTPLAMLRPLAGLRRAKADAIRLRSTAAPFLIISLSMAIGFQSHRLLLSSFGTAHDVAEYSLLAQFVSPLLSLVTVAGQNLWPRYRDQLAAGTLAERTFLGQVALYATMGLTAAGLLLGGVMLVAAPLTGGAVVPSLAVTLAACLHAVVTSAHQPGAMLLNSPRGLWVQAGLVMLVGVVAVPLTVVCIPVLGAAAPFGVYASCVLVLQAVPTVLVSLAAIRRSRATPAVATVPVTEKEKTP